MAIAFGHLSALDAAAQQTSASGTSVKRFAQHFYSVGDQWCYENFALPSGKLNRTWTETVVQVENEHLRTERIDRVGDVAQKPTIKDRDLRKQPYAGDLKIGQSWDEPIVEDGKTRGHLSSKVSARETIWTRMGQMDSFRIETEVTRSGNTFRQVYWFSPVVGNHLMLEYLDPDGRPVQGTELTCFEKAKR
jgi:hypothetical protein